MKQTKDTYLTDNFTLEEMTVTNTGIPNRPNKEQIANLQTLCTMVLQPTREIYGAPIIVTSGFRSPKVNRAVGGSKTSAHPEGRAADVRSDAPYKIRRQENKKIYEIIRDNFEYRQLIWEGGNDEGPDWVHVEYKEGDNKKQQLRL